MKVKHVAIPGKDLVVLTATGTMDLASSKAAIARLADSEPFRARSEVLLDLRDVACELSAIDVYDLATYMAWPNPALPTHRKIAVLVSGDRYFDQAKFLALCARNRGLRVTAFSDYDAAAQWLDADIAENRDGLGAPQA